jgi:hypothetical protein
MAFTKEVILTPVAIGEIRITMIDPMPNTNNPQEIRYQAQIVYSDTSTETRIGDLAPELTPAQINSLKSFIAAMRTKAVAEFIG